MDGDRPTPRDDEGFTLVELLVVIVVLGVLATITVFAVRGITDTSEENAGVADERTLVTAEEAHLALHDSYASEIELVEAGLLHEESPRHDIALQSGGTSYTIVPVGTGGGGGGEGDGEGEGEPESPEPPAPEPPAPPAPTAAVPTQYAGFGGQSFGEGAHKIVIISNGSSMGAEWAAFVAAGIPLATTEVIWLGAGDVRTSADVDAIVAHGSAYIVAAVSVPISSPGGPTYVGQYLSNKGADFWWAHSQGGLPLALAHYRAVVVPGG